VRDLSKRMQDRSRHCYMREQRSPAMDRSCSNRPQKGQKEWILMGIARGDKTSDSYREPVRICGGNVSMRAVACRCDAVKFCLIDYLLTMIHAVY
jgi:hypothetical protein